MRSLIIWSKDRACQLELLLRSLDQNAGDTFGAVFIVYKASTSEFQDGYSLLKEKYVYDHPEKPGVKLTKHVFCEESTQVNLEQVTRNIINHCNRENSNICFSTDDNIVYRTVTEFPQVNYGECFSLRLGKNTTVQNHVTGELQPPLNQVVERDGILEWNPDKYHPLSNYGYPWALDFHVYSTKQVQETIKRFRFKNTNELESGLFKFRNEITTMKSFAQSTCVNWPLNNMSGYTQSDNVSNEFLNTEFLSGKTISLDNISRQLIRGAHQSFKLEWNK